MTTMKICHCSHTPKCSTTVIVHKSHNEPVYQELQRIKVISKEKEYSTCQCQNSTQEYIIYKWPNSNFVVRNDDHFKNEATVSFGQEWSKSKLTNVVDVVNYYKPNPKSHVYLPENTFDTNGKIRGHMGGETTFRRDPQSNRQDHLNTHTNDNNIYHQFNEVESVDSDKDTVVPEARVKGLFEVPFDVYSMPRLIAPFKGFSKIITPRAIRLINFTETEEGKLMCKIDKNAMNILQKQVGDLNVVSVSFVGDPKSGKSFLASLLVGKDNTSFNISESYIDPNNMLVDGSVWVYISVYQEKHAYVFLDFEGFEHSEKNRTKMLLFAFSLSNLVFCNVKYSLMNGIHNSITAMIQLTKKPTSNETLGDHDNSQEENEFLEIIKGQGTRLLSRSYDSQNFVDLVPNFEDSENFQSERKELWSAPIVQFVFRDSSGFVKCIDDRIFTPETLVEQGIFENYLDLFTTEERDPNFRNEMLDSFEVFTNRKYISLPHPTLSTHPYGDNDYSKDEDSNLADFFMKLLSSDKNDFKRFTRLSYDDLTLTSNLSSLFHEKLDQLKSLLYHDTLNYAMARPQVNGRMFGEYLKKMATHFNKDNSLTVDRLNDMLSSVFLNENNVILKEALVKFLKEIRAKVAPKLPMDSKALLNLALSSKFTSLNYFESNAFGTRQEYEMKLNELSETLEDLIRKLENKNKTLMMEQLASYVDRKEHIIRSNLLKREYTLNDLNEDLTKLKKSLNNKFSDSELVSKVLARASSNLVSLFNDTHPETFVHNLSYSKSSSIEETFQNLNTYISNISSHLQAETNPKSPPGYSGAAESVMNTYRGNQNNKLDSDLGDNTLDGDYYDSDDDDEYEYEDYTDDDENDDSEDEVEVSSDDEYELEVEELEETETSEDESESTNNVDYLEEDDESDVVVEAEVLEDEVESLSLEDEEESEEDDSQVQDNNENKSDDTSVYEHTPDENVDEPDEEDSESQEDNQVVCNTDSNQDYQLLGECGGTQSFIDDPGEMTSQNFDDVYVDNEKMENDQDEVVEILEDDFAQEDIEVNDKKAVLQEIFEKSADDFMESRAAKNVPP
ncbi:Guanylate-binding protein domain protein [Theileria parva strain Muguga]|uniref:Guanylate-binding protein N-terminal domain-containing protein n=1 Tax=Theileria parva TaxID=5875 RepID=Q4N3S2_THEPA|nr:Guanylate-binding protein domain protein [Theileria parva strain Muguga]EAN33201.1 Guanylate-binding protein domain protein [Theileria parva strain Muguga]|eukprot:XP_765484.1 hypothetical protein [Theileria parva strain Muguga]